MPHIADVAGKQFRATAVEGLLTASKAGNPMVKVTFQLLDAPHASMVWNGMLHNEKSTARTLDSLRYCGWAGEDLADLSFPPSNEVSLVLENEEYEGKQHTKVQWVNKSGAGKFKLKSDLSPAERVAMAAKLKGAVLAHKQAAAAKGEEPDLPF